MSSTSSSISVSKKSKISADGQKSSAELFSFKNQNGDDIYGFLYRPDNFDPTKTYPTICYVYGGPSVQVVRNTFELPRTKRKKFKKCKKIFDESPDFKLPRRISIVTQKTHLCQLLCTKYAVY